MPSSAQREAMTRALRLLTARERNILVTNRQHGLIGVQGLLKGGTRAEAQAELDRIKAKLEGLTLTELRRPPEDAQRAGSSLAAADGPRPLETPALRSNGLLPASTPRRKRATPNFKEKPCVDCGLPFKPNGGRQVKCPACRGEAPVTTRHVEPAPVSPPTPVERPPATPAPTSVVASRYLALRDELDTLREQLDDFAARLDRAMESQGNDRRSDAK